MVAIARLAAAAAAAALMLAQPAAALYQNGGVTAPCSSPLYCYGDILRNIELAKPFSDSKTFVDMYVDGGGWKHRQMTRN